MKSISEISGKGEMRTKEDAEALQKFAKIQQEKSQSDLLEVGSWKGGSGIVTASVLTGDHRLWMVDHFRGSPAKKEIFKTKFQRRGMSWAYPETLENIIGYDLQNKVIILPLSSEKVAKVVDEKFSFIFIDGNHTYEAVSSDYYFWFPHLEKDGIMIFHDYGYSPVNEFCVGIKKNESLITVLETSTMIVFRRIS